jgi:hypothetical protein
MEKEELIGIVKAKLAEVNHDGKKAIDELLMDAEMDIELMAGFAKYGVEIMAAMKDADNAIMN